MLINNEDSKMVLTNTSVHLVEGVLKNGCHQCLWPQGEPQLPPASLGGSPRSVGKSDPGSFWITACALGLRACEILCASFKSGVSISHSPLALLKVRPAAFKAKCSGGLSCWCRTPGLGSPMWSSDHSLLGKNLCNCNYLPICGLSTWGCGAWLYHVSAPPTHLVVVPSLYL